jgi:hypothetical protein
MSFTRPAARADHASWVYHSKLRSGNRFNVGTFRGFVDGGFVDERFRGQEAVKESRFPRRKCLLGLAGTAAFLRPHEEAR